MFIKRLLIALLLLLPTNSYAADSTVTALTAASALNGTELFYCVQSGADRKCTGTQAGTYILTSPILTGTPTIPTPFTLGATSVTSTGTQLNYLNAATGTTGTTSTNVVFSTSPVLTTPNLGIPSAITLTNATGLPIGGITGLGTNQSTFLGSALTVNGALTLNGSGSPSQAACANLSNSAGGCTATLATQAEQETGSSTTAFVSPGRQQFHPSAIKAWARVNASGGNLANFNMNAPTKGAAGIYTINFTTPFSSSTAYGCTIAVDTSGGSNYLGELGNYTASTVQVFIFTTAVVLQDSGFGITCFGDQ